MQSEIIHREISNFLLENNIEFSATLPITKLKVINERKMPQWQTENAVVFLIPYLVSLEEKRNISLYAVSRDYHLYVKELAKRLYLRFENTDVNLLMTADNSPIDEVNSAAKAGLGVIGDNGLLINEKYGSYCFIGEVFTDAKIICTEKPIGYCNKCGKCKSVCTKTEVCLSELTQKKGILTEGEKRQIKSSGCAWGCDKCQLVCPMNAEVQKSPIGFFAENRLPYLDCAMLRGMSDDEFSHRAYSWRKRITIQRNIEILEEDDSQ